MSFDPDRDLARQLRGFLDGEIARVPSGLQEHCRIARAKPPAFRDHPPVVAVSLGGSNTKVVLGHFADGQLVVERVKTRPNPVTPIPWFQYLDELLLADPAIRHDLDHNDRLWLSFSIAVGIKEGVPLHPSKLPGLIGLVARKWPEEVATHHFGRNLETYFRERRLRCPHFVYQGDAVVAHLGGVAMTDLAPGDDSLILVCGNGLATANAAHFELCGMLQMIHEDPDLHPPSQMENGQYQYLVAGKGLFGLFRRAAALAGHDVARFFASDVDSRRVMQLCESELTPPAREVRDAVGASAFAELQEIAGRILDRGVSVLANCVLSTMAIMGRPSSGRGHRLFIEGSIARALLPRVKADIGRRINSPAFAQVGLQPPLLPEFLDEVRRVTGPDAHLVDLTLLGAAALAVAEDCLTSSN